MSYLPTVRQLQRDHDLQPFFALYTRLELALGELEPTAQQRVRGAQARLVATPAAHVAASYNVAPEALVPLLIEAANTGPYPADPAAVRAVVPDLAPLLASLLGW